MLDGRFDPALALMFSDEESTPLHLTTPPAQMIAVVLGIVALIGAMCLLSLV